MTSWFAKATTFSRIFIIYLASEDGYHYFTADKDFGSPPAGPSVNCNSKDQHSMLGISLLINGSLIFNNHNWQVKIELKTKLAVIKAGYTIY